MQTALDSSRICLLPDGRVAVEDGIKQDVIDQLLERGHKIIVVRGHDRVLFGRGQVIAVKDSYKSSGEKVTVLVGGSDGRADGCAMGS